MGFRFGPDTPAMGPCSPGHYCGRDPTCPLWTSQLHPAMITTPAKQDFHPITGPCESLRPYQETTMGRQLNKLEGTESLHMFSLQQMWFCSKFSKLPSQFNLHVPRGLKGNAHSHLGSQNVSVSYLSVPLSKPYCESTNKCFFKNTQMKALCKNNNWVNQPYFSFGQIAVLVPGHTLQIKICSNEGIREIGSQTNLFKTIGPT